MLRFTPTQDKRLKTNNSSCDYICGNNKHTSFRRAAIRGINLHSGLVLIWDCKGNKYILNLIPTISFLEFYSKFDIYNVQYFIHNIVTIPSTHINISPCNKAALIKNSTNKLLLCFLKNTNYVVFFKKARSTTGLLSF